ncbi:MAG: ATP-binding protein [Ktedonobacteraceae bacterium]|nr:ATP-binding protein [Ktedonobacteraceae bacterium]
MIERKQLQAEIDGLVAHLYGLAEEDFEHILSTFPIIEQSVKDAALDAYHYFALPPSDLELAEMIAQGENDSVEFKVAACWNARRGEKQDSMKDNIVQEVAAFLNSRKGGVVLIGVEDDGTVVGLDDDYKAANPQKQNRDGYHLFLNDALRSNLADNWHLFCTISFGMNKGKELCIIKVDPANEPMYTKIGDFYLRIGPQKQKLPPRQVVNYIKERW